MGNSADRKKSFVDGIWDFFASVKLAAITFALIALSSIVGTILEQRPEPENNIKLLTKFFGEDLAPTAYRIFETLGFMDMYHSWWFIAFLVIFSTNLIICSLDRLPNVLKIIKQPLVPLALDRFGAYPIKKEIRLKKSPDTVKGFLPGALKYIGFSASESSGDDHTQFYSQKGAYSRLGVYITHLSILIIFLGAVIGIFFGFNGSLNLPEGYTSEVAYSRQGGIAHPLGFSIRCDDFEVEFYKDRDMPKDYKSRLTILKNGREVLKRTIEVNTPLKYEGFTFYQSSYGMMPNPKGIFILNVSSRPGRSETLHIELNDTFTIPGTGITGTVKDFSPALAFRQDGSTFTYSDMMNNPAVFISFTENDREVYSGWILNRYPQTWQLPDGNRVEFVDYWGAQYTGLQVRKDPGVRIVYLGCLIIAIGLYATFFMSHRKIWVALAPDGKNASRILIAATANKNRPAVERAVDKLAAFLTNRA